MYARVSVHAHVHYCIEFFILFYKKRLGAGEAVCVGELIDSLVIFLIAELHNSLGHEQQTSTAECISTLEHTVLLNCGIIFFLP